MKEKTLLIVLVLIGFSVSAQIKTFVKDSLTGKAIPYLGIWSMDSDYALTSNKKGKITYHRGSKYKSSTCDPYL